MKSTYLFLICTVTLLTLSCRNSSHQYAPRRTPTEEERKNFNARPIDHRNRDLHLKGSHYPIAKVDVRPVPISPLEKPLYPKEILDIHGQGAVTSALVIDTNGKVSQVYTIYADDQLFADSAKAAMTKWKFVPAKKDGKNVSVIGFMTIKFSIKPVRSSQDRNHVFFPMVIPPPR